MFQEELNQNISLLGFRRVGSAMDHWIHADVGIEIYANCVGMEARLPTNNHAAVIEIWEDIWVARYPQVMQFLTGLTKPLKSVFARDTRIVSISAEAARNFLDTNHLMGFSKGALYVGCVVPPHRQFRGIGSEFSWDGNPLVGVAVFGKPMVMKEAGMVGELSGELIKLATLPSIRLVGGITKFLDAYHSIHPVHNVMTYIDLDWNSGKGFLSIGFKVIEKMPPLLFKLVDGKRVAVAQFADAEVWTKGNLKLRYYYAN